MYPKNAVAKKTKNNNCKYVIALILTILLLLSFPFFKQKDCFSNEKKEMNLSITKSIDEERSMINAIVTLMIAMTGNECFTGSGSYQPAFFMGFLFAVNLDDTPKEFKSEYTELILDFSKISESSDSTANMHEKFGDRIEKFSNFMQKRYLINFENIRKKFQYYLEMGDASIISKIEHTEKDNEFEFLVTNCQTEEEKINFIKKSMKFKNTFVDLILNGL